MVIKFKDHPEFRPNLTPRQMFKYGSFGGGYWRPIYSSITKRNYKNQHKKYPRSWFEGIPESKLTKEIYDPSVNKYRVKVGQGLEEWESSGWIVAQDPYGWVQWYCNFYNGRRTADDARQIKRWQGVAGENGRFKKRLINEIKAKRRKDGHNDFTISPVIRQILQHWAYKLTKNDVAAK